MAFLERVRWQVLSPLLDQLLDLDAGGRAARLAAIRRDDVAAADELGELLDLQSSIDRESFLDGSVMAREGAVAEAPRARR